tara:strand:+ start:108 stop:410 length:303 start_codon:yes stop_codon:yes gene_type:complete
MKFRITLFAFISGISGIFIPLNSANASTDEKSAYFFMTGQATSICQAYSMNAISKKNASMMLNIISKDANEDLMYSKDAFNFFVKNGENFNKYGCSELIK